MAETELPWIFTEPLERAEIPYMMVGAYATLAFGAKRTTDDLDLVIGLALSDIARLERAFPETEFYRPPRETLITDVGRSERGHFNLIHHATMERADCYLTGRDPLQHWAIRNRQRVEWQGRECWVAPPEVVILKKLEFFREGGIHKHKRDIQNILQLMDCDRDFIEQHVERLGLREQWLACQPPGH